MTRLIHSSKALGVLIALLGMLVLAALGRITFEQLWLSTTILIGLLTAATAAEDVAAKRPARPAETHTTNVITDRLPPPPRMPNVGDQHAGE